ncbi:MAG: FGGY-family carbohydrate kinase [Candidatus Dormibacteria bacterium]
MTEVLMGVDIGTSSTKGCLTDSAGRILRQAERTHATSMPKPGWFEHDADSVWWADFTAICGELLADGLLQPSALCISGIGPCLLPADADGTPLRPAILYGIDTRASLEIDELNRELGLERVLARGGSPLTSQAIGPKLLWLRRNEPQVWEHCRRFFMASSHIVNRLTGEYVLDHHSASQCDPLYDLTAQTWAADWAESIAPGLELPRLCWPAETAGTVTASASAVTGLRTGTPVMAGTIDAWAEAVSVEVRDPGDLMLMYGTTMFLVQVSDSARPSSGLWLTRGVFPGQMTLAAGMATSGALTSWFRDLTGLDYDSLFAAAATVAPGADGLLALPYFAGERTPLFDPGARGVIAGLSLHHGRGHIFRALLEATALGVRHNLETMAEVAGPPTRVAAVGGGTKGSIWLQIVSDACGLDQELHRESVGASYGDAWMAGVGAELVAPDQQWNPVVARVSADPSVKGTYDALYALYRQLYPATHDIVHQLGRASAG